jgi:multidrug efflux pump subunit AcrB
VTNQLPKTLRSLRKLSTGNGVSSTYKISDFGTSIHEVIKTLFEAFSLVIVVFIFLQSWDDPDSMITIPVSLIGTFSVMALLGFP